MFNSSMPLSSFVSTWLDVFKKNEIKPASFDRLLVSAKALEQYAIADEPIGNITCFDIQNYINQLTDHGYGINTIKKQTQIVTAPLKQAAALRVIPSDPCVGIRLPSETRIKKQKKNSVAYTKEEQARLWQQIDVRCDSYALCIGFMLETGLRVGEAVALRWQDINIPMKRIHVGATFCNMNSTGKMVLQENPKTKASIRNVPLTQRAIAILLRAQMQSSSDYVFDKNGSCLSYKALVKHTKQLCKDAGITYYGEHVFRHTFATNCYYKGIDVKILSKMLGHSGTEVTYNAYINLYGDGFEEMYQALNG